MDNLPAPIIKAREVLFEAGLSAKEQSVPPLIELVQKFNEDESIGELSLEDELAYHTACTHLAAFQAAFIAYLDIHDEYFYWHEDCKIVAEEDSLYAAEVIDTLGTTIDVLGSYFPSESLPA